MTFTAVAFELAFLIIAACAVMAASGQNFDVSIFCDEDQTGCTYYELGRNGSTLDYPLCKVAFPIVDPPRFGHSGADGHIPHHESELSIADFARLSMLAYEPKANFTSSLARWFGKNWTVAFERRAAEEVMNQNDSKTQGGGVDDWTTFFELVAPSNTTTVFAVRGTASPLDILNDIVIWSPVALAQIAGMLGPHISTPLTRATLIFATFVSGVPLQRDYYSVLLKHVKSSVQARPDHRFYITGHSLGGGLANLVAAEMGVMSITFSSPGLQATSQLLDSNNNIGEVFGPALHRSSYTVVPDRDIIARIDTHEGLTMPISCPGSALTCHSLGNTICEVYNGCARGSRPAVRVPCGFCPLHEQQREPPECRQARGGVVTAYV